MRQEFVRRGARDRLVPLAAAVLLTAALVLVLSQQSGRATSGGSAYAVPAVNDTNPDPNIVETTIVSDEATVDLGQGLSAKAQTYNGAIPGPTFRLKVGDTVIVHYENKLAKESGIHWHGIELANNMDGTPLTQNQVQPGGTFLYKFTVHRPGLFWYHPHHHSSTNQVFKGLYGMIIVTDPNEAALQASSLIPSAADTHPVVLSDTTVCKQPGSNDAETYTPNAAPHVSGGTPTQQAPKPVALCEGAPIDENGDPLAGDYQAGDIPAIQTKASAGRVNEGQTVLTNGRNVGSRAGTPAAPGALAAGAETMTVRERQGVRLQFLNAASTRFFRLLMTDATGTQIPLTRIGGEGGLLNQAVTEGSVNPPPPHTMFGVGEILLPPGTRADVAFGIPDNTPGPVTIWTQDYNRTGMGFANTRTVPVMHFAVSGEVGVTFDIAGGDPLRSATGDLVPTLGAATNNLLNPAAFVPSKKGMASEVLSFDQAATELQVNGIKGDHEFPPGTDYKDGDHFDSSRYAKEGDLLDLEVTNSTDADHPFHLHGFSIQPVSLTKPGGPNFTWGYPEFRDNVNIPKQYTLRFRVRIEPRPMADGTTAGGALGRWVIHCHIFFHATNGMLTELVVGAANGNEAPQIDASSGIVPPVEQDLQEATMTGKYKDRDGDAVALAASVGTVTDTGGGNWLWKHTPSAADSNKQVFVTATDAGGRKSQAGFEMQVTNTAPTLVLPGDQTAFNGTTPSIAVAANDPNTSDTVALSATGLPGGLSLVDNGNRTGAITGTVNAPPGEYLAEIAATDGKHAPATTGTVKIIVPPGKEFTGIATQPERLSKGGIVVGCRLVRAQLKSCRATVSRKSRRLGQATKLVAAAGFPKANVRVPLTRSIRSSIGRSVPGVAVDVGFLGFAFDLVTSLTDTTTTRVVAPRVTARPGTVVFNAGGAGLTKAGRTYLKKIAGQVGTAKRIVCTARPNAGSRNRARARSRARNACNYLKARGLKAKFTSVGAGAPGNRRVVLRIDR